MIKTLIFIGVVLFPSFVSADPFYLPKGKRLLVKGKTYQGYTLEEMKILLKMDLDLHVLDLELPKLKEIISKKDNIIKSKDKIISSKDIQIDLITKDRDRITGKWKEDNRLRHECEQKPRFGSWVAWTVAAITTGVAIGLGIAFGVR
jgi:hypothetical protein